MKYSLAYSFFGQTWGFRTFFFLQFWGFRMQFKRKKHPIRWMGSKRSPFLVTVWLWAVCIFSTSCFDCICNFQMLNKVWNLYFYKSQILECYAVYLVLPNSEILIWCRWWQYCLMNFNTGTQKCSRIAWHWSYSSICDLIKAYSFQNVLFISSWASSC